ncbi:bleomycin resistance protein [Streptomyces profundus]|uniref:bleomycin resistance protein n=1 Tax=Streptomyces profundus TaxID=2867410 RepID=UPI001D1676D8|nr:VOC family protein [Streptomyces sp. MA3_2.13]UED84101.1 VOC family protein [Streptomyces sp. MA3_2.13]
MTESVIPLLPCLSLDETLDFYRALDFEVTFHQPKPYPFGAVRRGGIQLQFFGMRGYDPARGYGGAYVNTDDVDTLHAAFRAGLKRATGRVPTRGLPRLGTPRDMSYGVRQFLMTDPGGNTLRFGQPISDDFTLRAIPSERYARALHQALLLGVSKGDHTAGARIIDHALAADGAPPALLLLRLLVLRAELAVALDQDEAAAGWLARAEEVPLDAADRASLADELGRLDELRATRRQDDLP